MVLGAWLPQRAKDPWPRVGSLCLLLSCIPARMEPTQSRSWGIICPGGLLQFPHVSLTSVSMCSGLSCKNRGWYWCPHPSDEEWDPFILTAQPLRAGAQPFTQGMAARETLAPWPWLTHAWCQPPSPSLQLTTCCRAQGPPSPAGSLSRNLVATLQDIETKRQLALQQKGELWLCVLVLWGGGTWGDAIPAATRATEKGAWPRVATAAVLRQDAVPLSRSLAFPPSLSS